jgi:hypothetical protein
MRWTLPIFVFFFACAISGFAEYNNASSSGSGFPLTSDADLNGHVMSNGTFKGMHLGSGAGLTDITAANTSVVVNVAYVSNGPPGSAASVVDVGSNNVASLGFVLPVGATGIQGTAGTPGAPGPVTNWIVTYLGVTYTITNDPTANGDTIKFNPANSTAWFAAESGAGGGLPRYMYSSSPTQYVTGNEAWFADYSVTQQVFIPSNVLVGQTFFIGGLHPGGWRIKPDGTNMVIVDDQSSTNYISVTGNYPSAIFVRASNFYYAVNHWGTYIAASDDNLFLDNLFLDNFESYANGTPLINGINSWYGSSSNIMVQTNIACTGTQAAIIPEDCTLSNRFASATSTNVWVQMDIQPALYDGSNPPAVNTNVAVMFYINTSGYFIVHDGPATNWVTTTAGGVGPSGTNWITVRIFEKFNTKKWDLYANSILVTNNIGFINPNLTNFAGFDVYNGASTSYLDNVTMDAEN